MINPGKGSRITELVRGAEGEFFIVFIILLFCD